MLKRIDLINVVGRLRTKMGTDICLPQGSSSTDMLGTKVVEACKRSIKIVQERQTSTAGGRRLRMAVSIIFILFLVYCDQLFVDSP